MLLETFKEYCIQFWVYFEEDIADRRVFRKKKSGEWRVLRATVERTSLIDLEKPALGKCRASVLKHLQG